MAIHERIKEEQKLCMVFKGKAKISSVKKQAQLADVSNTGKGSIKMSDDKITLVPEQTNNDIFDDWDDDIEAFE